jgi:hypothetical protein
MKKGHYSMGPQWINLYGATLVKAKNVEIDPTKLAARVKNKLGVSEAAKATESYNRHPNQGSTYRGRVLISQRITDEVPARTRSLSLLCDHSMRCATGP